MRFLDIGAVEEEDAVASPAGIQASYGTANEVCSNRTKEKQCIRIPIFVITDKVVNILKNMVQHETAVKIQQENVYVSSLLSLQENNWLNDEVCIL